MTDLTRWRIAIHGGVGTPDDDIDGCRRALGAARAALRAGKPALEAAVDGCVVLEDTPSYNAGTGASYRLDGETIELDAALMCSDERIGAVAALERVKNPIRVARQVMDGPHILLAGPAATRFARAMGHAEHDVSTPGSREKYQRICDQLARGELPAWRRRWLEIDLRRHWNFETPYRPLIGQAGAATDAPGSDTVGLVICDGDQLAVALSTGGASPMLAGRVGDTPLPGAGYWVSPAAAVTATGVGEEIARKLLCRWIHDRIEAGEHPQAACEAGVARYAADVPIGALAVTPTAWGVCANKVMAWAAWDGAQAIDAVGDGTRTGDQPDD